jgi:3-deoxy-D-manno-octulosonic-acid transferase
MPILYDIFIFLLGLGFRFSALFYKKAALIVAGRKNSLPLIKQKISTSDKVIWMHCASLGEFEQGKPVFEALKKKYPNHKLALSFFSSSGYEVAKNYPLAEVVFYLPLDSKKKVQSFISALHPSILVLVKYDYWYNLLAELDKKNIPTVVISSIFRPNQIYFSAFGIWFLTRLKKITHFFVQNKQSKKILNEIGIQQVTISGDTRYDAVRNYKNEKEHFSFLDKFCLNHKIIVVGSSWKNDEALWVKYINEEISSNQKIIIAPHEINKNKIKQLKLKLNKPIVSFSEINQKEFNENQLTHATVFVLDTVGLLKKVYAYASIAYVGGGLDKGGVHNVLEPAAYGIPVLYGKKCKKYQEAMDLVNSGGGFIITNYSDLVKTIHSLLINEYQRFEAGKKSLQLIESSPNATKLILEKILLILT